MGYDVLLPVAVLSGLATYLIRYLPILLSEHLKGREVPPRLHRFLLALGPSAIAALLALSVADLLPADQPGQSIPVVASGLLAVFALHRLTGNLAWATLGGAISYGLASWILGL